MMTRNIGLVFFSLGVLLFLNSSTFAAKTCWCWIGPEGNQGWVNQGDPSKWKDFGGIDSYPDITPYNKKQKCSEKCAQVAADSGLLSNPQALCNLAGRAVSASEAARVGAFSLVGSGDWAKDVWDYDGRASNFKGCSPKVCTCPQGWISNGGIQRDGGVTTDGKCKRMACQAISIVPLPPDGTQLGSWGFTWGNALYAWGDPQNGGAARCVINPL